MKMLNYCTRLFLGISIVFIGFSCQKEEDANDDPEPVGASSIVMQFEDDEGDPIQPENGNGFNENGGEGTTIGARSTLPMPEFHVMDPNWGQGRTCFNCLLELGVISEPGAPGFIRYEWKIGGATLESNFNDGRYVFVKTRGPNTGVYFAVRGVYQSGVSAWYSKSGQTINGTGGGSGSGGSGDDGGIGQAQ